MSWPSFGPLIIVFAMAIVSLVVTRRYIKLVSSGVRSKARCDSVALLVVILPLSCGALIPLLKSVAWCCGLIELEASLVSVAAAYLMGMRPANLDNVLDTMQ